MQKKLSEKVLIVMAILAFIVIGIVIVANLSNNKVMASEGHTHTYLIKECEMSEVANEHKITYFCIGCDSEYTTTEKCTMGNFRKVNDSEHLSQCTKCYLAVRSAHVDSNKDGICDYCKNIQVNANTKHKCSLNGVEKIQGYSKIEGRMSHTTHYSCGSCNFSTDTIEDCNLKNFYKLDASTHIVQCDKCYACYEATHEDANNDGICDSCGYEITKNNHVCSENSKQEIVKYDDTYHDYYLVCTICENPVPAFQKREAHVWGEYTSKGSEGHSRTCKICGYELVSKHTGATHENGGKCTVQGCGYRYERHENSNTLWGYSDITDTTHTRIYKCTQTGCNKIFKGTPENHIYQNGKCVCSKELTEIKVESEKYKIENTYISKVKAKTSVDSFKSNITTNGTEIKIYNKDNKIIIGNTNVGTGSKIEIKSGNQTKTYIVVVNGDINGDGNIDFVDVVKMNKARLNKTKLNGEYFTAADVNNDGKIDLIDIVKINKFRLNKSTEL